MPDVARIVLAAAGFASMAPCAAVAVEYIYGSWVPAADHLNRAALPLIMEGIAEETGGEVTWKLVPGGQLAGGKETFAAVEDRLMDAGLGIPIYLPSAGPTLATFYNTIVAGDDVVAVTGAVNELLMLNCPKCLEEMREINILPLAPYSSATYHLFCVNPVDSVDDLNGLRIRATGGFGEIMSLAGATPISATLTDAVGLLQRGGLDCVVGNDAWLKIFGYGDFAKHVTDYPFGISGPALAFMMNRDTYLELTPDQKITHLKWTARLAAEHSIGNFVVENDDILKEMIDTKSVQMVPPTDKAEFDALVARYYETERDRVMASARELGLEDASADLDAYQAAVEKWRSLSKAIGRDPVKFYDALWAEVYSKVDPEAF